MTVLYLIAVALAGAVLGALAVHLGDFWDSWGAEEPKKVAFSLTLHGLKNPFAEFQRSPKNILQALWRFFWALGFCGLHFLLWTFVVLGFIVSYFGLTIVALFVAVLGPIILILIALGVASTAELTTADVWAAWSMIAFAATYGLSLWAGRSIAIEERK